LNNNNVTESSKFDIAARLANASFATVKLGSTYDWYKPITINDTIRTFNVTSKTTPIGSFEASFKSEAGKSSTGFEISAMMYFLTIGFEKWDGYAVYNDPELMFYAFKGMAIPPSEPTAGQNWWFIPLVAVAAAIVVTLVVLRKRIRKTLSRIKLVKRTEKRAATSTVFNSNVLYFFTVLMPTW
jgi:hypothetical protein